MSKINFFIHQNYSSQSCPVSVNDSSVLSLALVKRPERNTWLLRLHEQYINCDIGCNLKLYPELDISYQFHFYDL